MSVPVLFIGFPILLAPVAYLLRRTPILATALAMVAAGVLGLLALGLPLGPDPGSIGGLPIETTATVLGRSFEIEPADRLALVYLFWQAALVFMVSAAAEPEPMLLPAGLANLGLLAAALLVRPLVFAAIFLAIGAALAAFMLAQAGGSGATGGGTRRLLATRGALRYLVYSTLSLPFILLTGWLVEASAASPGATSFVAQATVLLMLGLAIQMAVVPFHSWLPAIAQHSPPFAAAFVFSVMRLGVVFLLLTFLHTYPWLGQNPAVYRALTLAGGGMALAGALFTFGQRNFGRVMGYVVLIDIGAVMLALGLATSAGVQLALTTLVLRSMALPLWALGLSHLRRAAGSNDFDDLAGVGRRYPVAAAAVVAGMLSVAGFPLLGGFAGRWALLNHLAVVHPTAAIILLLGTASVSFVCARGLVALLTPDEAAGAEESQPAYISRATLAMYGTGFTVLLVMGLFPQWVLPAIARTAEAFTRLGE